MTEALSPKVDFKTLEELRDAIDKQAEAWKPLTKGKHQATLEAQLELNKSFMVELERLQEAFLHFKLHTLALVGAQESTECSEERTRPLKCISNPFHLYAIAAEQ